MYDEGPNAFHDADLLLALLLAGHATITVEASRTQCEYREAMESRYVIGQAKGIVMAHNDLDTDRAIELLSCRSQQLNIRVRALAEQVIRCRPAELGKVLPREG